MPHFFEHCFVFAQAPFKLDSNLSISSILYLCKSQLSFSGLMLKVAPLSVNV